MGAFWDRNEQRLLRLGAVAGALAAVVALPGAIVALVELADTKETVDLQAITLQQQNRTIALQEQELQQQRIQFLELRNLTAPHYASIEVRDRLDALQKEIERRETTARTASTDNATRASITNATAEAWAFHALAVRAWDDGNYTLADLRIDAAYDALDGVRSVAVTSPQGYMPGAGPIAAAAAVALAVAVQRARR